MCNIQVTTLFYKSEPLDSWWGIEDDVGEVGEESVELFGTFAMEDTEEPGDHLELDGFQFTFFRLFRRGEPI